MAKNDHFHESGKAGRGDATFSVDFYDLITTLQAFLDFRGFDFRNFGFTAVYNSIIFPSPLVLLGNLDLRGFCFRGFIF